MLGGASDISYRDRALRAEARVAELEATVAEYERQRGVERREAEALALRLGIAERVRPLLPQEVRHVAGSVAKLLSFLLAHPVGVHEKFRIVCAISKRDPDEIESDKLADVIVCHARKALVNAGLPDAITTCWGRGYALNPARAEALAAWCEGRA